MDAQTEAELLALLDRLDAAPQLRVVVFTAAMRACSCATTTWRCSSSAAARWRQRGLRFALDRPVPEAPLHRALARIEASPCIFIAAINGHCMGGGYELALACDLRYAQAGSYRIGLPEVNIGLLPGAGGTQKLHRVMGHAQATEALLLGRTFEPADAAAHGLVNACVADVLAHALSVAQELALKPQPALGHIKRLAHRAGSGDAAVALAAERTLFCDTMVSDEALRRMAEMNAGLRDISER